MAVSSDSPFLGYLSYYHVLEYFFEDVFNDEVVGVVTDKLTAPSFSYRRKGDIQGLIKTIQKWTRRQREDVAIDEQSALALTLRRFVDFSNVKCELDQYDAKTTQYLKQSRVDFAEAESIDLEQNDIDQLAKSVASRIYKIRNALVHSKEGRKPKYIPFRHDQILSREVPFIRFIAEEVIIKSSKALE